jgi:hypothetical protein
VRPLETIPGKEGGEKKNDGRGKFNSDIFIIL